MTTLPSGQVLSPPSSELSERAKQQTLYGLLELTLATLDYPRGACSLGTPVDQLFKPDFIESLRRSLELCK
jgi:hypothetical protein